MAECPRVLAGKATTARGGSSVDGLWVSRAGQNVYTCADGDLLFDSKAPSFGQILLLQEISYSASGTTTQDYLNHGGVKTYFFGGMLMICMMEVLQTDIHYSALQQELVVL